MRFGGVDTGFCSVRAMSRKGARMPSIADDEATEMKTERARVTGSRR